MALATVAEARAFDKQLIGSAATFPDANITSALARIAARFAAICGVYFEPTTASNEYLDGDGSDTLILSYPEVTAVTAVTCYESDGVTVNETFDAADLADLAIYTSGTIFRRSRGTFPQGRRNIKVTYTHGLASVPADIKRAALLVCVRELIPTNMPADVTSYSDGQINWSRVIDPGRGRWYGMPEVDGVLREYRDRYWLPGIS